MIVQCFFRNLSQIVSPESVRSDVDTTEMENNGTLTDSDDSLPVKNSPTLFGK